MAPSSSAKARSGSRSSSPPKPPAARASRPSSAKRPLLQVVAAATGAVATLGVMGVLAVDALRPQAPAEVSARIVAVKAAAPSSVAVVELANHGDETAAQVRVGLRSGDHMSEAVVDYLPGRGRAVVYLPLANGTANGQVRVGGWSHP